MGPPRQPPVGRNLANQRKSEIGASNSGGGTPATITCYVCKKNKPQSQYAKRQLLKYQDTIYNPYAPAGRSLANPKTTCRTCTPQQVTELTCCVCTKTKSLDSFAKNQRKAPDVARCVKCVQLHLDAEPDDGILDADEYVDSDSDGGKHDFDEDPTEVETHSKGQASQVASPRPKKAAAVRPKVRRGYGSDPVIHDENVPVEVDQWGASLPPPEFSVSINDDWEQVIAAGTRSTHRSVVPPPYTELSTAGPASYTASAPQSRAPAPGTKAGGWAKVEKLPKGQDKKWGAGNKETDEWDVYARSLGNRRNATKKPVKKKQIVVDQHSDGEEWD